MEKSYWTEIIILSQNMSGAKTPKAKNTFRAKMLNTVVKKVSPTLKSGKICLQDIGQPLFLGSSETSSELPELPY